MLTLNASSFSLSSLSIVTGGSSYLRVNFPQQRNVKVLNYEYGKAFPLQEHKKQEHITETIQTMADIIVILFDLTQAQ